MRERIYCFGMRGFYMLGFCFYFFSGGEGEGSLREHSHRVLAGRIAVFQFRVICILTVVLSDRERVMQFKLSGAGSGCCLQ